MVYYIALYNKYLTPVYRYIASRVGSNDAEDLAHEVFIKVMNGLNHFDGKSEAAWIFTITRNLIVDFYRKFIPDFGKSEKKTLQSEQKLKLKDIVPEVFVKGYPPKCPHQPTVIDDDEVKGAEEEGKIVMRYPQNQDEGFIPRNYVWRYYFWGS